MKKVLAALLLTTLGGCFSTPDVPQIAPPVPDPPTKIEGLDLEFKNLGILWGYTSITFSNQSTGFITTSAGSIIRTIDGGSSWADLKIENYVPLWGVFFLNQNEGWAVGGTTTCWAPNCNPRGAIIYHTVDGGATWQDIKMKVSKPMMLYAVWFRNSNIGFAVTDDIIIRTTDGGATWTETTLDLYVGYELIGRLFDITFLDDQHGIAGATLGKIARTDDGGDTWNIISPFGGMYVGSLDVATDGVIYACGQQALYHSSDYGKTWDKLPLQPSLPANNIEFISQQTGFIFGIGDYEDSYPPRNLGSIFYTKNGGQTWKGATNVYEATMIVDAVFLTAQMGYGISSDRLVKITVK